MGGLVSQYFLEVLGGWKDTRALVSFGTPYRGSLNALGYLANGFSEGIGPLKVDLTSTLASFTGVYQLLPAFECVDRGKGKLERIGEIDGVVGVDPARAKAALGFYEEIKAAAQRNGGDEAYKTNGYETYPIVGLAQPTFQSATVAGGKVTLLRSFDGKDNSGDGTVPRVSATPFAMSGAHREIYVAEQHGSLQNFDPALVNLLGVLTGFEIDLAQFFSAAQTLSLDIDDVYGADDVTLRATPSVEAPTTARIEDATTNALVKTLPMTEEGDVYVARATPARRRLSREGDGRFSDQSRYRDGDVPDCDLGAPPPIPGRALERKRSRGFAPCGPQSKKGGDHDNARFRRPRGRRETPTIWSISTASTARRVSTPSRRGQSTIWRTSPGAIRGSRP